MKAILTAGLISFSVFSGFCVDEKFFKALAAVESSNNPKAYNKSESAIGIYQIRYSYFLDSQKQDKSLLRYTHKDCFNPEVARRVVVAYMMKYNRPAAQSLDYEALAKCHNAGLNWRKKTGQSKQNLETYWSKFKKHI